MFQTGPFRIRIHHEGTKDTKVFVGCASRTGQSRNISRKDAKAARGGGLCHFDRREKSFSDPSHSFGMTGLGPSLGALCVLARVILAMCGVGASEKVARAAQIFGYSDTESLFKIFIRISPRPPRRGGAISEPCFTEKPEDPTFQR